MLDDRMNEVPHLVDIRRYHEARGIISQKLAESPRDAQALYWAAYIHWILDENEASVQLCIDALSQSPKDTDIRFLLVKNYQEQENFVEAEALIIELIRENPASSACFKTYAEIMLFTFNLAKAKELISEAVRLDPVSKSIQLTATLIDLCDGKHSFAEEKLQKLIAENPGSEHVLRMLLVHLVNKQHRKPALILAQEILRKNPSDENLVELIIDLKAATHWTALPLWLNYQYGNMATGAIWVIFIVLLYVNRSIGLPGFGYIVWGYISWVVYSWLHPVVFKKIVKSWSF